MKYISLALLLLFPGYLASSRCELRASEPADTLQILEKLKAKPERALFLQCAREASKAVITYEEADLLLTHLNKLPDTDLKGLKDELQNLRSAVSGMDIAGIDAIKCSRYKRWEDTPLRDLNKAGNRPTSSHHPQSLLEFCLSEETKTLKRLLILGANPARFWDEQRRGDIFDRVLTKPFDNQTVGIMNALTDPELIDIGRVIKLFQPINRRTEENIFHRVLTGRFSEQMVKIVRVLTNPEFIKPEMVMTLLVTPKRDVDTNNQDGREKEGPSPLTEFDTSIGAFSHGLDHNGLDRDTKERMDYVNSDGESVANLLEVCRLLTAVRAETDDPSVPHFSWDNQKSPTTEWIEPEFTVYNPNSDSDS